MSKKKLSNEEHQRLVDDMEDEIAQLKHITNTIHGTLKKQKQTRDGLGQYLDQGTQALKKINQTLYELGGKYSIFGCNGCIVAGIAVLTIMLLVIL